MNTKTMTLILACAAALVACGKTETSAPAASNTPAATTPAAAPAAPENTVGKSVFGKTCALCHSSGAGGAPRAGDKADWGPRIAQGNETLYKHALEGFTGAKGTMPARGTGSSLTDAEVKSAVDYMVSLAQ